MVVVGAGGPPSLLNRSLLLFLGGMGEHTTTTQYNNGGLLACFLAGLRAWRKDLLELHLLPPPFPDFASRNKKTNEEKQDFAECIL